MMKPVSVKQYLLLGVCFCAFAIVQGLFVQAIVVKPNQDKADEILRNYHCSNIVIGNEELPLGSKSICDEKEEREQRANDAENLLQMIGFGGGLGGVVMIGLATLKGRRNRRQTASAAA